jgi:hypothetical protein
MTSYYALTGLDASFFDTIQGRTRFALAPGYHIPAPSALFNYSTHSITRRYLLQRDHVVVGFVDVVEELLQRLVSLYRKKYGIVSTKEESTSIHERPFILRNSYIDLMIADRARTDRRRTIGVVERVVFRQSDRDLVFFGPWVVKVDWITPRAGAE